MKNVRMTNVRMCECIARRPRVAEALAESQALAKAGPNALFLLCYFAEALPQD